MKHETLNMKTSFEYEREIAERDRMIARLKAELVKALEAVVEMRMEAGKRGAA